MMAKSELFKSKFVAGFLKMLGGYPVNREGNDVSAVRTTLALLKNDKTVNGIKHFLKKKMAISPSWDSFMLDVAYCLFEQ